MIAISVLIPVYNAEKHLECCINSLVLQTLSSFEFIFINDGSKDSSQSIIERYQKNDSRIVLINQENQGVSVARNTGLKAAKGKYIGFVDADDSVAPDYFQHLHQCAESNQVAIVVSNHQTQFENTVIFEKPLFRTEVVFSKNDIQNQIIPYFIREDKMNPVWNKLYLKSLIDSNAIVFPKGVIVGEDGVFNIQAFNQSPSAFFTNNNGYFYREVSSSATRDVNNKDYFKIALNQFHFDYKKQYAITLEEEIIVRLKSIRLVHTILSLTNIYINSNHSFAFKYRYVNNMMHNKLVQNALKDYWVEISFNKGNYQKFILYCIKVKSFFLLFSATKYSNFRNNK
jgi:glycosyltransferase involved in cell wall biosynthesis